MNIIDQDDIRYKEAERRVKKIKNFYVFTFIYVGKYFYFTNELQGIKAL